MASLHDACRNNCYEEAKALIVSGSDINNRDKFNRTALHIACWKGDSAMVQMLLRFKADVMLTAQVQQTSFIFS